MLALLQYHRESFVRKVVGIDDAAAAQSPVVSGTSLLWLTKHLAGAESAWFLIRFAGQDVELPDEKVQPGDTVEAAVENYRQVWSRVAPIVEHADLDEVCRRPGDQPQCNLRWIISHMLEETARHAGHADILRELIDGSTGR